MYKPQGSLTDLSSGPGDGQIYWFHTADAMQPIPERLPCAIPPHRPPRSAVTSGHTNGMPLNNLRSDMPPEGVVASITNNGSWGVQGRGCGPRVVRGKRCVYE